MTKTELLKEFKLTTDWRRDPYGSALSTLFDVAAELWWRGECPPEWEYSPGAAVDPREHDSEWAEISRHNASEPLIEFGSILNRYTSMLRLAGRDY